MLLKNKKIIVTGGPTREWLDPVRFISNSSSGKMGIAIADEAVNRAKEVIFIHGPINNDLIKKKEYKTLAIESTVDLLNAVINEISPDCVLIMAAAPGDYSPEKKSETKIKKSIKNNELVLKLKKNPDILKEVAGRKEKDPILESLFLVGFAAETNNIEEYAKTKLKEKKLDMICLNDVSRKDAGFAADTNVITIFTKYDKRIEIPMQLKKDVAKSILNTIEAEIKG